MAGPPGESGQRHCWSPGRQGKLQRHDGIGYELVLSLDAPVLQMVEQLPNVVQFFAAQLPVVAEPVIDVPKILPHDVPARRLCCDTQLAEQLVEVPTIVSYSSLQRTVEHHVDIPVPGGEGRNVGLQGSLPEQSSTAPLSSAERLSDGLWSRSLVLRWRPSRFSPRPEFILTSHFPAGMIGDADEPGEGFFATFPPKKVRNWVRTRVRECPPVSAHPRRLLSTVFVSGRGS